METKGTYNFNTPAAIEGETYKAISQLATEEELLITRTCTIIDITHSYYLTFCVKDDNGMEIDHLMGDYYWESAHDTGGLSCQVVIGNPQDVFFDDWPLLCITGRRKYQQLGADNKGWYKVGIMIDGIHNPRPRSKVLYIGLGVRKMPLPVYFSNIMLVDLSNTFGLCSEPDLEWCFEHLAWTEDTAKTVYNFPQDVRLRISDGTTTKLERAVKTITDRTLADTENAMALQSTIAYDHKGAYNASDLNRVENQCKQLAEHLTYLGYSIKIETKTDWVQADIPYMEEQITRIRNNVNKLRSAYIVKMAKNVVPTVSFENYMTYNMANDIERIFQMSVEQLELMTEQIPFCDVYYSGELY